MLLTAGVWGQTRPNPAYPGAPGGPPSVEPQRFETTSTAIVVDVVVRDAKGALVTDLVPEDFELYEDRLRQSVGSFSVANRGTGIAVAAKKRDAAIRVGGGTLPSTDAAGVPEVTAESGLTALVFDRLAPDNRVLAQQAALSGIPLSGQLQDSTAVFAIDLEVNLVQPFTRDPTEVRAGLHRVGGLNASQFQRRDRKIVELQERRQVLGPELTATVVANRAAPSAGGTQAIGSIEVELAQNRMESRMLEMFDTLEREQQGYSTTNALLSVVASLQEMPGRKTIVFFSEGLAVPPAAQAAFRSVVDTANRANVTIYTVDASGLRAESTIGDVRREMTAAGIDRIVQIESGALPIAGSLLRGLERNEDMLRMDPHTSLGDLSRDTGGFLVRDTNNLQSAFRRIDEDMRFHYVLTYAPSNQNFDGQFREIDVKVRRPGARVFARRGYFAVRSLSPMPILGYESVPLAALDQTPLPNAFPMRAAGLSFPEGREAGPDADSGRPCRPTCCRSTSTRPPPCIPRRPSSWCGCAIRAVASRTRRASSICSRAVWVNWMPRSPARSSSTGSRNCSRAPTASRPWSSMRSRSGAARASPRSPCRRRNRSTPASAVSSSCAARRRSGQATATTRTRSTSATCSSTPTSACRCVVRRTRNWRSSSRRTAGRAA